MHPTAMPSTVYVKNSFIGACRLPAELEVLGVAAIVVGRIIHAVELAPGDLHHDVTGRWTLPRRVARREEPVAVEAGDLLQRADQSGARRLRTRSLERLREQPRRRPAVHGEEVG